MRKNETLGAVIVAAGKSARFGTDKMLLSLNGTPIVKLSTEKFLRDDAFKKVVVVAGDNRAELEQIFSGESKVTIVSGGEMRGNSVLNGVIECDCDIIAVHDGARPFVSHEVIADAIDSLSEADAACPAIPVTDTIKRSTQGTVIETLKREELFAVQTPQVFRRDDFLKAARSFPVHEFTDDCSLLEHAGYTVKLSKGEVANKKITTADDIN